MSSGLLYALCDLTFEKKKIIIAAIFLRVHDSQALCPVLSRQ